MRCGVEKPHNMDKESLINKATSSKKDTLSDVSILRGLLILLAVAIAMGLVAFTLVLFVWSSVGAIECKCRLQISVYNAIRATTLSLKA